MAIQKIDFNENGDTGFAAFQKAERNAEFIHGLIETLGDRTFFTGMGEPDDALGVSGDVYLDGNLLLYGPKTSEGWGDGRSLRGSDGDSLVASFAGDELIITNARTGAEIARRNVRGLPGVNGTSITAAFEGYELVPRNALTGAELGRMDARGQPGLPGADGKQFLNGEGPPPSGLGDDGDMYLDLLIGHVWGPKANGMWAGEKSIVGPDGTSITAVFEGYDLVITNADTGVEMARLNVRGEPGADGSGDSGSAQTYAHTQSTPATVWVVDHLLGKEPFTIVYDSSGERILAQTFDVSINQLEVLFSTPQTGRVECAVIYNS